MALESTVFIVDDDEASRDALALLLESMGLRVASFASARGFLDAYHPEQPGCLLLDVRMPEMGGLELQRVLKQRSIDLPVIFITGHGDVSMSVRAIKDGAVDFLEKPFPEAALLDRVHEAIARDARRRGQAVERAAALARFGQLTPREREVMGLVVSGLSNKAIANALGVSARTVETHRARVMEKMGAGSVPELVSAALHCGVHPLAGKP